MSFSPSTTLFSEGGNTRDESASEGAIELSHPWTSASFSLFLSARGVHFGLCLEFNKVLAFDGDKVAPEKREKLPS